MLLASCFLLLASCDRKKGEYEMDYQNLKKERELYKKYSYKVVTREGYNIIFNQAEDSLENWAAHSLKSYLNEKYNPWNLDSLICFNKNADKCVMVVAHQNIVFKDIRADGLTYFFGVKIKGKWFFFGGPYLALPREGYQRDTKIPISFDLLRAIAMDNIFKGYLKKNKESGEWEINDRFFSRFYERDAYNLPFTTQEAWEESWLKLMRENWEKRDTTNYSPLQ